MTAPLTYLTGGPLRSLSVRNYRLFFFGQLVSLLGTWMQMTAQDWLVLQLRGGGTGLGAVLALQFTPILLLSLYGGVLADRHDKRRLLMLTQSCAGGVAVLLAVTVLTHTITLPLLFVLAAMLGTANAFDTPTRQSFVVEIVGPELVQNAVALNSVTFNTARVVGPAIAGLLISPFGTGPIFAVNAVSYAAVLVGLARMRASELHPARPVARERGQLIAGLRYVRARRDLLLPIMLVGVVGTFGLNFPITLSLMARSTFGGGAALYGLFSSVMAVGSLCGALLATGRGRPRLRLLLGSALAFGVLETAAGLMPTVPLFIGALVLLGLSTLTFTTTANATVQLAAGTEMRGRVMALYILVFMGGTPLGAPLVGVLSSHLGPRVGLLLGGLSVATATTVAGLLLWHQARSARPAAAPSVSRQSPAEPQVSRQSPSSSDSWARSHTLVRVSRSAPVPAALGSPSNGAAYSSAASSPAVATPSGDGEERSSSWRTPEAS